MKNYLIRNYGDYQIVVDGEEKKTFSKKDNTRTEKVIESFKSLEKAKKDWLKSFSKPPEEGLDAEEMMNYDLNLAYKKKLLKDALMDLGPTSKLINELVKSMETALKSDFEFDKELKRLEYRLPLFNDTLRENHNKLLKSIIDLNKEDITTMVPEATLVIS